MRNQNRIITTRLQFLMIILLCMVTIIFGMGTAYARYQKSYSEILQFTVSGNKGQVYIREASVSESEGIDVENEAAAKNYVLSFVLSNGNEYGEFYNHDQTVNLSMFATIGLENPDNYVITLIDGEMVYQAVCYEVVKGMALYTQYGPGWIYRFYNDAGEEVSWYLVGSQFIEKEMYISIQGESELPAAINLIASIVPDEI